MSRRDRPALDNPGKRLALGLVELRRLAPRLAIDKPVRPRGVEAQHPVTHRLQTDTANPRRLTPRAAVVDRGQRQQATTLIGIARPTRKQPKRRRVEIISK